MARYCIRHTTTYHYQYPVVASHHSARLRPLDNESQICESFRLQVEPDSTDTVARTDYFGNTLHLFSIQEAHDTLAVMSESVIDVIARPTDLGTISLTCGQVRAGLADIKQPNQIDAWQYLYPTELTPDIPEAKAFGQRFLDDDAPLGLALLNMLDAFQAEFEFDPKATEISTPVSEVLTGKRGVCQDFAHAMIASLHACGLSARYASGYILTHPKEGEERMVGADASHAWVSVHIPGTGWVDVDPTNCLVCGDQHARVAYGRDYSDVSMLKGAVTGGGSHTIDVAVSMVPI